MVVLDSFTDLFYVFISIVIILFIGFKIGRYNKKKEINKNNLNEAERLYKWALDTFKTKDFTKALHLALQSASVFENHESYNLIGHIYNELNRNDLEAEAFDKARWNFMLLKCKKEIEKEPYYYYRAAHAYFRKESYEFSFLRSESGINYIALDKECRFIDDFDTEAELRAIRLLSIFKLLSEKTKNNPTQFHDNQVNKNTDIFIVGKMTINEANKLANDDANWLLNKSNSDLHNKIAKTYLEMNDVSKELYFKLFGSVYNLN